MLQIYKASAGSGKTHILTQDYLKLSFQNPNKFSKILAVTFTNKASEEMKNRIISELNNIIELGKEAPHYQTIKDSFTKLSEQEIKSKALFIRNNILHNYSQFAISTIDSFVQKIIRSFAFEINVPGGYKIEMDTEKVISDIIDILYHKIEDDKQLQKWLSRFALYKIEQGKNWDFRDEIKKLSYEIFKEKFQSLTFKRAASTLKRHPLADLLNKVFAIKIGFENRMKNYGQKAEKIIENNHIDKNGLGRNFKTIANYLTNKIVNNQDFEPNKTIYKALDSEENWYAKKVAPAVKQQILDVYPQLSDLLQQTVNEYETNYKEYLTAKNVISNFHAFGVLSDIANILPDYRAENNLLLISDTTLLLKKIISDNDAPFIYEKTGNKFQNILIDEFQDTSGFQWHNFRPLINNSLANGEYDLIVGDIKQSIYRWRGGDWNLLLQEVQKDIGENFINEKSLNTNWRSKKNIIDFNNSLFRFLPDIAQKEYNTDLPSNQELIEQGYAQILTSAYADTFQYASPKTPKTGGRVKIHFIKVEKSIHKQKRWRENITELIPKTIDNLLKDKNYTAGDITILVRKNKEGKEIVDLLLDYMNNTKGAEDYNIISSDSLYINNSPCVRLIINALKFILNKNDFVNLTSLIYEEHKINNKETHNLHEIFKSSNKQELQQFLPENFINNIEKFSKHSLYELVETIISIFELHLKDEEYPYLRTFQDVVLSYIRDEYSDLQNFINWWDEKGINASVNLSEKIDAVNIMTIHKSKGLSFKIVIIPFLDWQLDHNPLLSPIIWCKSDKKPYDDYSYIPLKYKAELAETYFSRDYYDEKLYTYMDAINMLYVAFTRPVEELIVMSPFDGKNKNDFVSDLLYNSVQQSNEKIEEDDKIFIPLKKFYDTEENIFENNIGYEEEDTDKFIKEQKYNNFATDDYPVHDWRKNISIVSHATDFFIESIKKVEEKVNYGKLMHEIFAEIITTKDIDKAIDDKIFQGKINQSEKEELKQIISDVIAMPEVSDWFSDKWKVKTETEILSSDGEIRIPDRILFGKNKVIVIDFKFGEIRSEYQEQIAEYMKIISEIEPNKQVEGYLLYADKKKIFKL